MIDLPLCKHRGHTLTAGRFECHSLAIAAPIGVTVQDCQRCPYRDRDSTLIRDKPMRCRHLGGELGMIGCYTCGGNISLKVFSCDVYECCTLGKKTGSTACCRDCPSYVTD